MSYNTSQNFNSIILQPPNKQRMITVDRDYDEVAFSSESSTVNSGSFSLSTNTSIHNEYDIDTSMSISGLNSQLFLNNNNSKQRYQTQSHYQSYHDNMPISSTTDIDHNNNILNSQKQLRQEQLNLYNYNHQYNKNKRGNHYLAHTKEIIKPSSSSLSSSNNIDTILRRDDNRRKYELLKEANINHNHFLHSLLDTSEEDEDYDADYDDEYNEDNDNTTSTNITTPTKTTSNDNNNDMKCNSDDYIYDSLQQEIEQMEDFEAIDALELEQQFQQLNI